MEPFIVTIFFFLSTLRNIKMFESTGPIDAGMPVITEELPSSTTECSIKPIMNRFIQFHILFGQRSSQAGMLRVKKLDYWSPC